MIRSLLITAFLFVTISGFSQEAPTLVVSSGHHQTLMCVDISPDGKYVASGGSDNLVKIYDMRMQQELNTITGHSYQLSFVEFSKDGKYLLSATRNELLVHTHPEGKMVFRKQLELVDDYHFYGSDNDVLYISVEDEGIYAYDLKTGNEIKKYPNIEAEQFYVMPDGKTLITSVQKDSGEAGIGFYSFPEGELLDFIPIEGIFFSRFDSSRDGKTILVEMNNCKVAILDVKTKTIRAEITAGVGMLNIMKVTPDGKQVVTSTFDNFVRFWDVNTGKKIKEIADISPSEGMVSMALAIKDMDFSDDGKIAAFCYSDIVTGGQLFTVEWFDVKTMKSLGKHQGDVKLSMSISIDQSGKILSTGTIDGDMGIKCIDISTGSQKAFLPGVAYHGSGGKYMCATSTAMDGTGPSLDIYRMPAIRKIKSFKVGGYGEMTMSVNGSYVAMSDAVYKKGYSQPATPVMRIWNIDTDKEILHLESEQLDMPRKCLFDPQEEKAFVIYSKRIVAVDLATGNIINTVESNDIGVYNHVVSPDGKVIGTTPDGVYAIDFTTGAQEFIIKFEDELTSPMAVAMSPDNSLFAIAVIRFLKDMPNRVLVYDWATKSLKCELVGHTTRVGQLTIGHDNQSLFSVDDNGIIAMWDLKNCKPKASFLAFGAEDYMIITPKGYYKSSKGNLANVGFRQNGKLYTFDQFDLRYNRPDKVLESIGIASEDQVDMYRKAYQKRLSRMGFTEEDFSANINAPELEIVAPENLPLTTTDNYVDVNFKAWDEVADLDRLNIYVNGIPIYGKLGKSLKNSSTKNFDEKERVQLVSGTNRIQATVMNSQGIESARVSYSVDCKKAAVQPNLYIIAYGVRKYQDSSMNLTYSDKDARDIINIFKEDTGPGKHYKSVTVQILTNDEVLKEKISDARALLEKSNEEDQAILFYSGHGLLDQDMDYYLSTHDVDFAHPETRGLAFNDFQDLIDGIPARNRLMLVDACHSGEVDKDEVAHASSSDVEGAQLNEKGFAAKGKKIIGLGNTFELMKELFVELRKESGATVIASSAGKEYSLESDEWKNGVFTYALREALVRKKADANHDKSVTVSELKSYLFDRVKELTDGKQTPTVRRENLQHDYVIY